MTVVPPGSTIGILGGGQLGRMLAMAAAQLGYRCHIFCPESDPPAGDVAAHVTIADYADESALAGFAKQIAVATYEFENVPVAAVQHLAGLVPVRPSAHALEIAQDRQAEKSYVAALGGRTAPFAAVDSLDDLIAAVTKIGAPAILKIRRFGYDGKGQARLASAADAASAWAAIGAQPAILEGLVRFDREISVLVARGLNGASVHYGPVENEHRDGILQRSHVPASVSPEVAATAVTLATDLAQALDYVGVLGVEMFVAGDDVLFNEMAPRVHNSGHWTIEGAVTSQFENHIRAICGLPLGSSALMGAVEMHNLIGADAGSWRDLLADPTAHLHLYGKGAARPGRKMGHVTWVRPQALPGAD